MAKDADIADIKGPLSARRAWWPWLLAAALGALAWEAYRRWKARPAVEGGEPVTEEPPVSPEDAAETALAALAAEGLWERGEHAAYYLKLTEILRAYLEARYGEPATAMTSVEVARLVKAQRSRISKPPASCASCSTEPTSSISRGSSPTPRTARATRARSSTS